MNILTKQPSHSHRHAGFTLIELLVALVIGLVILLGVVTMFTSNKQTTQQNDNFSRMQENARYAIEVLSRDIRETGGISCGSGLSAANVLNNSNANWWSAWGQNIVGFDDAQNTFPKTFGTATHDRLANTDALIILSTTTSRDAKFSTHDKTLGQFSLPANPFVQGDIVMACDFKKSALFQVTASTLTSVTYGTTGTTPGNCSTNLGFVFTGCGSPTPVEFDNGGALATLSSHAWYIGTNDRNGSSLFRLSVDRNGGEIIDEIVENVTNLQVQYLQKLDSDELPNNYVTATAVTNWDNVVATRITLTTETEDFVGYNSAGSEKVKITRNWDAAVTLRNRRP